MSEKNLYLFQKNENQVSEKTPKKFKDTPKNKYTELKKGIQNVYINKHCDQEGKDKEEKLKSELEELKNGLYSILSDINEPCVTHDNVLIKKKNKVVKKDIKISDIWKYLEQNVSAEDYSRIRKKTRQLMKEKYGDKCDVVCCKKPVQMTTIKENGKVKKVKVTQI